MDARKVKAILQGKPAVGPLVPGSRVVIRADEQLKTCGHAIQKLLTPASKYAAPIALASSQLPPIF